MKLSPDNPRLIKHLIEEANSYVNSIIGAIVFVFVLIGILIYHVFSFLGSIIAIIAEKWDHYITPIIAIILAPLQALQQGVERIADAVASALSTNPIMIRFIVFTVENIFAVIVIFAIFEGLKKWGKK